MLNAIGDSLCYLARSNDEEDGEEDGEADTVLGKLSEDDEPDWVMGAICKSVPHCMESFWQKQMRLDELTQPGWGYTADYFCEKDVKYGMTELKVSAVVKPKPDTTAPTLSPTTCGELMQTLDIIPRQSQIPHVMSRPGNNQIRLGSEKTQTLSLIAHLMPDEVHDLSQMEIEKPVEPISFYRSI